MVLKKILIIGASGYLGSRIAFQLDKMGYEVILQTRKSENLLPLNTRNIIVGDINDKEVIKKFEISPPDIVIHLISLDKYQSELNLDNTLDVNVRSTWRILDFCRRFEVKKFIYFSTVQVYRYDNINHISTIKPQGFYGLSHLLSEEIVRYYNSPKGLNAISVRLSNSFGEPIITNSKCWDLVVNNLCEMAVQKGIIRLNTDDQIFRDFIHYSSVLECLVLLIESDYLDEDAYNITSGDSISLLSLAELIREIYYKKYNIFLPIYLKDKLYSDEIISNRLKQFEPDLLFNKIVKKNNLIDGIEKLLKYLTDQESQKFV
jgi:nucleoside-diphosphate-sugar epimerase